MANGQFVISGIHAEAEQAPVISVEPITQQYTPETQPATYAFVKNIEARLESYRETAVAIEETKHKWLKSVKAIVLTPKPVIAELIEKESKIGGRLFQKQDPSHDLRFWEKDGGWYCGYSDGGQVKLEDSTIHYEFTQETVEKLYQGRPLPFVPYEKENLLHATQAFEHAVVHELYPIDETLQELKNDDLPFAA